MADKTSKAHEATLKVVTGIGREASARVDPETGEILDTEGVRKSLRDMMDSGEYEGSSPIEGDQPQMSMIVESPHTVISSRLKIKASDLPVKGQFKQGTKVRLVVEVEVGGVSFKPRKDSMGYVTGVERYHEAEIVDWAAE